MKSSFTYVAASLFFCSLASAQFTYWVDATCRNTPARTAAFNKAITGAIDFATQGFQRLQSATDTQMKDNFQKLFKTDWNTNAASRQHVTNVIGSPPAAPAGFQGYTETQNRPNSNVRIYCDNDPMNMHGGTRWTLAPDPPIQTQQNWPGGYTMNMLRPRFTAGSLPPSDPNAPQYMAWEDVQNGVSTISQGCQTPNTFVQGETYVDAEISPSPVPQNAIRSVITICDAQLNSALHSFDDIPNKKDINTYVNPQGVQNVRTGIDAFNSMTAQVLFHEFCHTRPTQLRDLPTADGSLAYTWTQVLSLNAGQMINNVNNYTFLVILAKLATRHWRLSAKYNDWHNRGTLVYDLHGITSKVKARQWVKWRG